MHDTEDHFTAKMFSFKFVQLSKKSVITPSPPSAPNFDANQRVPDVVVPQKTSRVWLKEDTNLY